MTRISEEWAKQLVYDHISRDIDFAKLQTMIIPDGKRYWRIAKIKQLYSMSEIIDLSAYLDIDYIDVELILVCDDINRERTRLNYVFGENVLLLGETINW